MSPLLQMRGITKSYPGVAALRDVDLTLCAGEVLCLMGENGAGKSTLIKILAGAVTPDAGTISINGELQTIDSPSTARRAGIGVIFQEFNLIPGLSARENIFLGREKSAFGWINHRREQQSANQLLKKVGANFDCQMLCKYMSVAQQQTVEIAKALSERARILVMDEPTASLTPQEVEKLMQIIEDLRRQQIGVVYISHRLDEVFRIADRITVLRDGQHIATKPCREMERHKLIELMVGREIVNEFPQRTKSTGDVLLSVAGLSRGKHVCNVSFEVRRGEILAITGLIGSGRTELVRLIFGADQADGGLIALAGCQMHIRSPRDAIAAGICLLTEDRKQQGLVLGLSILDNFGLPNLNKLSKHGIVHKRLLRQRFAAYQQQLNIKSPSDQQQARYLSGGNQQKVVLAKWLMRNSQVIIFDEPTRGIDVGAKYEIYQLMHRLANEGKAILMISSELPEVLGMADRILVMYEGAINGEIRDVSQATQQDVLQMAVSRYAES